jgi:integrase
MPLSDRRIRNTKPKRRRYRLSDAHGLALEVSPAGGRYWRYRYRLDGRENIFAAGEWCSAPYGETVEQAEKRRASGRLTLAEARIDRVKWRAMVVRGSHPLHARRAEKLVAAASNANTFDAVAAEFVQKRGQEWGSVYRKNFTRYLERDVSPDIGSLPIREVNSAQVLGILRKVEARGSLSAAAAGRSYIGQVFRYAIATGKADIDPTFALRGALVTRIVQHHPPLERVDLPAFFEALNANGASRPTEIAIRLMAYLFSRTIELRASSWGGEFDLDRAEWRIPASRMKMGRPHIVPLPTQAVALLRELHALTGDQQWLFPNTRRPKTYMGGTTINRVIERMGFLDRFTAHGFRATASTLLHEAGFDSRLIEMQLAHQDRNKSRASYDHSARLPERRQMMQSWADMLDEMMKPKSNVFSIRHRSA